MKSEFLEQLNESQRAAVEYTDGPSLVIAGAGSGKTRVLTYKIAFLLEKGMKPWNILALTFTNKAAREMKERIASLVGPDRAQSLWMGTFHSLFNRILRQEAKLLDFNSNYTIYQPSDCKSLVNAILKEMGLDNKVYKPGTVCGKISEAKNALILPDEYMADTETYQRDKKQSLSEMGQIYARYVARMHQANAMDFDDLLLYTYLLFEHYPDVKCKYAARFHYILVDEYQDTNYAQHEILRLLSEGNEHVCVVGDDAQSIYSFRGARIDNILKFTQQYEGAKLFKLERNYRSTQTIVGAANSLIANNKEQIKKDVYSKNEIGSPLILNVAYSDVEEGEIVCNRINMLHSKFHLKFQDIAVLYRTNAQSRIFEEGLRKRMIPYRIYGGRSFYDQKEIRDVLAYFRLVINPDDEEALKRIINYPTRGIGNVTLEKVIQAAVESGVGVWEVLKDLERFHISISSSTSKKLNAFYEMIDGFIQKRSEEDAYQLGSRIIKECGIFQEAYKSHDIESQAMQDNLSELLNAMNTFVEFQKESGDEAHDFLTDYLSEVSLLSDTDNKETENEDMVTLMTVHSAKGLEFEAIFIVGMEENLFPNAMALFSQRELEEERRLFYVALTRAKNLCFLSCSKTRFKYGKMDFCEPSSFLKEIDKRYLRLEIEEEQPAENFNNARIGTINGGKSMVAHERERTANLRPLISNAEVVTEGKKLDSIEVNGQLLKPGLQVEHERFGVGEIMSLEGEEGNVKAIIRFRNSGEKCLLLKYAKIKLI